MPNRFVAAIRSGKIDSLEELKTAFKELAKATHPDLAEPDSDLASGAEFVAVRRDYENALRDFEKHRFGLSRLAREGSCEVGPSVGSGELWPCLALFLKRGFPKEPRHEKEIMRYGYARWRWRGALRALGRERGGPDPAALFDAFEEELLALRKALPDAAGAALAFLRALASQAGAEHAAMRVALVRDLEDLRLVPGLGPASLGFLEFLAGELGIGRRLD